ncbi:hypothetical protein BV898_07781 [Hypsibius exemplaris]|uniref:EB domain-containing protein n=1 Tax=Hypsibius exemplaris TaxID=2072580 RepID=A0A1W0WSM4_HYPEX|nr:hypothetical protein BV898_07781 [Hypsibius exemplaris]
MSRFLSLTAVVLIFALTAATVYGKNEQCREHRECLDAGTGCKGGRCRCWTDSGNAIADFWACDDDSLCEKRFPGTATACRPTEDCRPTSGLMGYCQPR